MARLNYLAIRTFMSAEVVQISLDARIIIVITQEQSITTMLRPFLSMAFLVSIVIKYVLIQIARVDLACTMIA